jgi:hypothetical protein
VTWAVSSRPPTEAGLSASEIEKLVAAVPEVTLHDIQYVQEQVPPFAEDQPS